MPRGSYYYQAIATAKALGIAQGSNGYFWPNSAITREESMALVARALKVKGIMVPAGDRNTLAGFYDRNEISDYAKNAVTSLGSRCYKRFQELYLPA
ncbi:MAG: S-layer homology domain-containing protein [Syntrophomonadaceae bacterium]